MSCLQGDFGTLLAALSSIIPADYLLLASLVDKYGLLTKFRFSSFRVSSITIYVIGRLSSRSRNEIPCLPCSSGRVIIWWSCRSSQSDAIRTVYGPFTACGGTPFHACSFHVGLRRIDGCTKIFNPISTLSKGASGQRTNWIVPALPPVALTDQVDIFTIPQRLQASHLRQLQSCGLRFTIHK